MKGYGKKADGEETRSTKDLPMTLVVLGIGVLAIIMWLIPALHKSFGIVGYKVGEISK